LKRSTSRLPTLYNGSWAATVAGGQRHTGRLSHGHKWLLFTSTDSRLRPLALY
jgi:hypothetical protein